MDDIKLAKELSNKYRHSGCAWMGVAHFVQRLVLEARLDELKKNFTGESYTDYVNKLLSQLKELEG